MVITDSLEINVKSTSEYAVVVTTGTLIVHIEHDGAASGIPVTTSSKLTIPSGSTLTFALTGDTASITRL